MEEWGFVLVNAVKAFDAGNNVVILWMAWHWWLSGIWFSHNCYCIQAILLISLAMIFYGISMLPLDLDLKLKVHTVLQP